MSNEGIEQIVLNISQELKSQKSFSALYPPTIQNIVSTEVNKRLGEFIEAIKSQKDKKVKKLSDEVLANTKSTLHQVWDAYFYTRPDWKKLLAMVEEEGQTSIEKLLLLHSSTNERKSIYPELYQKVFAITGKPRSVLDIACGFNPLSWKYMNLDEGVRYYASDIDSEEIEFLNLATQSLGYKADFSFTTKDLIVDDFETADIAFLFKALQPVEQQKKGISETVLRKLDVKWFVITFPTRSISGKNKGMREFYMKWFTENIMHNVKNFDLIEFDSEMVYVCEK